MSAPPRATTLKFPAPPPPKVAGLLPFNGGEVLVTVTFDPPRVKVYDPITSIQVTHDLTTVVTVLTRAVGKAERLGPRITAD